MTDQPGVEAWMSGVEYQAADLDRDGDDELIISMTGRRADTPDFHGQSWIYAGGPDFQLDTPTVVIRDANRNNYQFELSILQLDEDGRPDLVTLVNYDDATRTNVFFGHSRLAFGAMPDRTLQLGGAVFLDGDGDGVTDIFHGGVTLYRSGSGKSARKRSYARDDVDDTIISGSGTMQITNLGYLNSKRYAMLGGRLGFGLVGFSGGPNGPDHLWDAFSGGGGGLTDYPFQRIEPIPDCTGDGWDDLLVSGPSYGYGDGIAMVLAGGPHIPGEDPTVGVQTLWRKSTRSVTDVAS